jgi:hypothetical protein
MRSREEIESEIARLAEGVSNDEEIDLLQEFVTELLDEREQAQEALRLVLPWFEENEQAVDRLTSKMDPETRAIYFSAITPAREAVDKALPPQLAAIDSPAEPASASPSPEGTEVEL